MSELEEALHADYLSFFEKAERQRRWNASEDIPWDRVRPQPAPDLVLRMETFYVAKALAPVQLARDVEPASASPALSAHLADWAYESSKHAVALGEWLVRSGARTRAQLVRLARSVGTARAGAAERRDARTTDARGVAYGSLLFETAAFVLFARHRELAARADDEALVVLHDFIARDELAHARFHEAYLRRHLAHDRRGTLVEMGRVLALFEVPGSTAIADWATRTEAFAAVGLDRGAFFRRVYLPSLRRIGVERGELSRSLAPRERRAMMRVAASA